MIILLAVSAIAVFLTLCYASLLDIRERRVRFRTWYPMLAVGIPASVGYYCFNILSIEESQFPSYCFLILGIALTLHAASTLHTLIREPEIPTRKDLFDEGLMWGVIAIPVGTIIFGWVFLEIPHIFYGVIFISIFCVVFILFERLRFFGGADALALIFIAVLVPAFPARPFWGYPLLPLFPFTVLVNAVILNLFTPFAIYAYNVANSNRAPFPYAFLGFPVQEDRLPQAFGYIMEEIQDQDGRIDRRFITVKEALGAMLRGERRIYTKDLGLHPKDYREELGLYKKAGKVWISYGVPFIVPISAGFIIALIFGDILFTLMKVIAGV